MAAKIKNDSSRYLTRASLAGPHADRQVNSNSAAAQNKRIETERRDDKGKLDNRWYIELPRKR